MSLFLLLASDGIYDEAFTTSSLLYFLETESNKDRNNIDMNDIVKIVRKSRDDGSDDNITTSIVCLQNIEAKYKEKGLWIYLKKLKNY